MKVLRYILKLWMANPIIDIPFGVAAGYLSTQYFAKSLENTAGQGSFDAIVAGICAAAVGFSITAVTILLSVTPGVRLKAVFQSSGYPLISLIMVSLLALTVIANILAYAALINSHSHLATAISIGLAVVSGFIELRLISIFYQVFALLILESKSAG
jgi:hypothetical protein